MWFDKYEHSMKDFWDRRFDAVIMTEEQVQYVKAIGKLGYRIHLVPLQTVIEIDLKTIRKSIRYYTDSLGEWKFAVPLSNCRLVSGPLNWQALVRQEAKKDDPSLYPRH